MSNKAIDILTSCGHFYINLGLDRMYQILDLFGNPQDKLKYIHVAGTNGKGSVCAIMNTVLQKNGFKTGLFTSPHIFKYNERIKVNDEPISDEDFEHLVIAVAKLADENNIHLTEFEILTTVAFLYFEKNNVNYVVLEVGLGGRLDATNVIKNNSCAIITHIDLEHTERLGNTIDKIAFEKAGIIKNNCPVITAEKTDIIKNRARELNSEIFYAQNSDKNCSLKGIHQKLNLGLALKACEILGIEVKEEYLLAVKNPCRFELLENNIIVDVAHNPNSIEVLRKNLDIYYPNQKFDFIFGCLNTKNYKKMLELLLNSDDRLYVYEFSNPNTCSYEDLAKSIKTRIFKFCEYEKSERKTIICGSFYMLKELFLQMGIKYNYI